MNHIMDWFRFIKTFDGKKENSIAYEGKIFEKEKAIELINETHNTWKDLKSGKI